MVSRHKVKIVEKTGDQVQSVLTMSDPWGQDVCHRPDCMMCCSEDSENTKCRTENAVYENQCMLCKKVGVETKFIGETSR